MVYVVVVGLMLIPLANHLFSKWRMDESVQTVNQPTNTNDVGVQTVEQSDNTAEIQLKLYLRIRHQWTKWLSIQ